MAGVMNTERQSDNRTVTVIGAGSWGTALAIQSARNGYPTKLWGRDPEQMAKMAEARCNSRYLPNITFPELLEPTADLEQAVQAANIILVAVPSSVFRHTLETIKHGKTGQSLPKAPGGQ